MLSQLTDHVVVKGLPAKTNLGKQNKKKSRFGSTNLEQRTVCCEKCLLKQVSRLWTSFHNCHNHCCAKWLINSRMESLVLSQTCCAKVWCDRFVLTAFPPVIEFCFDHTRPTRPNGVGWLIIFDLCCVQPLLLLATSFCSQTTWSGSSVSAGALKKQHLQQSVQI